MVKRKVAPPPGAGSTQMRPPWRSTMVAQSASPRPVPGMSVPCSRFKGLKIVSLYSGGMPCPLSCTANSHPSAVVRFLDDRRDQVAGRSETT
jgi:hypothetical protein